MSQAQSKHYAVLRPMKAILTNEDPIKALLHINANENDFDK